MTEILKFKFDMLPPNHNEWDRMHWGRRTEIKEAWIYHILVQKREQLPETEWDGPCWPYAKVEVFYRVHRRRDQDNATAMLKPVLDALRRCKVIENDSYERCRLQVEQQLVTLQTAEGMEMVVQPIAPPAKK